MKLWALCPPLPGDIVLLGRGRGRGWDAEGRIGGRVGEGVWEGRSE